MAAAARRRPRRSGPAAARRRRDRRDAVRRGWTARRARGLLGTQGRRHPRWRMYCALWSVQRVQPVPEQLGAGVPTLLGVELGGRQGPVLNPGDEPVAVLGPRDERLLQRGRRAVLAEREVADAVGMHEVEALVGEAFEQDGPRRRRDGVPAHVRQNGRLELLDDAGPLAAALGVLAVL